VYLSASKKKMPPAIEIISVKITRLNVSLTPNPRARFFLTSLLLYFFNLWPQIAGGEGFRRAETSGEFGGVQAALAEEPAEKTSAPRSALSELHSPQHETMLRKELPPQ